MEVFVFVCRNWVPTLTSLNNPNWPRTTEEMHPCWFPLNPNSSQDSQVCDLPYNEMWPDDRFWLPSALMGRRCLLWSHFRRPLSVQKPEASSKDPFELLCYQLKTFDCPSELLGISDQSTIFNST
ncbi:unnamed protein product [Protopolystoma xenopodis]|uniref:Uncharacterized protein n=1 Tax=Protopolystoma xenopodis TaxID=117903 RepID=A0A448WK81_9PLAT|nr:unnamed protein product [Protopolystoma xenopodis]